MPRFRSESCQRTLDVALTCASNVPVAEEEPTTGSSRACSDVAETFAATLVEANDKPSRAMPRARNIGVRSLCHDGTALSSHVKAQAGGVTGSYLAEGSRQGGIACEKL